jgi:hypothetical protein
MRFDMTRHRAQCLLLGVIALGLAACGSHRIDRTLNQGTPSLTGSSSPASTTPPPLQIAPTRSRSPESRAPSAIPLLTAHPDRTVARSSGTSGSATIRVSNDNFDETVDAKVGDLVKLSLMPERGHGWKEPQTAPPALLTRLSYSNSRGGTLEATYRVSKPGRVGISAAYDCGPDACPQWSVTVSATP